MLAHGVKYHSEDQSWEKIQTIVTLRIILKCKKTDKTKLKYEEIALDF